MSCGGVRNHENGVSKFDVIHDFIKAYLATTCPKGCIYHPCKRVFKSYTLQCILRSLLCSVSKTPCASPKHDVGVSLWPVSLKIFGRYLNLTENVSNNFKYPYLIYWAIMFFLFVFCFATVGLLWTLQKLLRRDYISRLIWITIRNSLVRLLSPVHPFLKSMYLWTL